MWLKFHNTDEKPDKVNNSLYIVHLISLAFCFTDLPFTFLKVGPNPDNKVPSSDCNNPQYFGDVLLKKYKLQFPCK